MQQPPAYVLASWPEPNYIDPVTHGYGNVIMNIVMYLILCMFLSLRIWTRTRLRASFGTDDVLILLAMIPTTGFFILSLLADLKFMWTRHQYDIPVTQVEFGLKMVLLIEIMFASACTLTKLSMLMLVRRMLAGAALFWRRIVLGAVCIVSLQGGLFCIILVFQCRPPQDYWKVTSEPQPNCINQASSLLVAGVINTLTDFLVVLLPIRAVCTTNLPSRQTMVVSFLFTLGFLSCFAGIIRTYYMWRVTQVWDQVWHSYPVWVSAAVELYIGIICASIPATKAFFQNYFPKIFSPSARGLLSSTVESDQVGTKQSGNKDMMGLRRILRQSNHAQDELENLSITSTSTASRPERIRSGDGNVKMIGRVESLREKNRHRDGNGNYEWNSGKGIHVVRTVDIEEEGR